MGGTTFEIRIWVSAHDNEVVPRMPGCLGDGEAGHKSKRRTLSRGTSKVSLPLTTLVHTTANNLIMEIRPT